jgi:hypothetical protein
MARHQFTHAARECSRARLAHLQPKTTQDATQAHLSVVMLGLHQLSAVSSARVSCAGTDLQCTERNHPSRISCAIPRASFRSAFHRHRLERVEYVPRLKQLHRKPSVSHPRIEPLQQRGRPPIQSASDRRRVDEASQPPPQAHWQSSPPARHVPSHPRHTRSNFPATRRSPH